MACEESRIIPQDIIIDILCGLPAKTLGRFRCVSKEWLSLLSEPHFIKTHQKTLNRNHLLFISSDCLFYSLPFDNQSAVAKPLLDKHYDIMYGCSCNGLVLASGRNLRLLHTFIVFNPTTNDYVEFPMFRHDWLYNPGNYFLTGFGYDSVTDDYKVVCISYFHCPRLIPPDKMFVHVYSLRSNTWRKLRNSPYDHSDGKRVLGVFVNGFLHWIVNRHSEPVIAAFSLADEKFSELPSPDFYNDVGILSDIDCRLFEVNEKLAIFHGLKGVLWLMNKHGVKESWTKIVLNGFSEKIVLNGFSEIPMSIFYQEVSLFGDNGKLMFVAHDQMIIYDLEEGTFAREIHCLHCDLVVKRGKSVNISDTNLSWVTCAYVESLVSPKLADPIRNRQRIVSPCQSPMRLGRVHGMP
ncbi:F-box associated domain containing protein [Tanacetum coccineum]